MKAFQKLILLLVAGFVSVSFAADEHSKVVGQYTIHYNAFSSDFLSAEVARQYGLKRSKQVALVNITVIDNTTNSATTAFLEGNAYNLAGQNKDLAFKEIKEQTTVYYLANFRFANQEKLTFRLNIKPKGEKEPFTLEFKQTMYFSK